MDADERSANHPPLVTNAPQIDCDLYCQVCGKKANHFYADTLPGTDEVVTHSLCDEHVWPFLKNRG